MFLFRLLLNRHVMMSLCIWPTWGFTNRVENHRFVEMFVMYVLVETIQNWYRGKLGCLHLDQVSFFTFHMRTLEKAHLAPSPNLMLAAHGVKEEQQTKLNSYSSLKFTFPVSKNLRNPSFGVLFICLFFFLGINLQTLMSPLIELLTVELKL